MEILLEGIKKSYNEQLVLDIDRLHLKKGRIYCLMGKNGAGKTTLLRILAGLDKCFRGKAIFRNEGIRVKDVRKLATMVFQTPYMFNSTVWENVAYGLKARHRHGSEVSKIVKEYLEMLELYELSDKNALKLSAGQIQRVALARGIAFGPSLLLLDEPTSSADEDNKKLMTGVIRRINHSNNTTVVIVTHDMEQALSLTEDILIMENGGIALLDGKGYHCAEC